MDLEFILKIFVYFGFLVSVFHAGFTKDDIKAIKSLLWAIAILLSVIATNTTPQMF
jgi:hypothetical protein